MLPDYAVTTSDKPLPVITIDGVTYYDFDPDDYYDHIKPLDDVE